MMVIMAFIDTNTGISWARIATYGPGWWKQEIENAHPFPIPLPCDAPVTGPGWVSGDEFPWTWPDRPHIKVLKTSRARHAILLPTFSK